MAIYHLSMQVISRSSGRSATAAAAYRAGCKITDDRTGTIHDYTRKRGVVSNSVFLPVCADDKYKSPSILWNEVEQAEKRKNSCVAREIVVALPAELNEEQRGELAKVFSNEIVKKYGVAVQLSIHEPSRVGDDRNHHAHILMSTRRLSNEGFKEKTRELDDKKQGVVEVEFLRERWADLTNSYLKQNGVDDRIDHRSLKEQGIDRVPSIHEGVKATAMKRRGEQSDRSQINRLIKAVNEDLTILKKEDKYLLDENEKIKNTIEVINVEIKQEEDESREIEEYANSVEYLKSYRRAVDKNIADRKEIDDKIKNADREVYNSVHADYDYEIRKAEADLSLKTSKYEHDIKEFNEYKRQLFKKSSELQRKSDIKNQSARDMTMAKSHLNSIKETAQNAIVSRREKFEKTLFAERENNLKEREQLKISFPREILQKAIYVVEKTSEKIKSMFPPFKLESVFKPQELLKFKQNSHQQSSRADDNRQDRGMSI